MCGQTNDTLSVLFQEIGCHLRASDEIREGMANIFFTIVLAAISGLVLLRLNDKELSYVVARTIVLLGVGIIAFGEMVLWGIIASRKWHAEYVNCMILVQSMITHNNFIPDPDLVSNELRYPYSPGMSTSRTYLLIEIGIAFIIAGIGDILGVVLNKLSLFYIFALILIISMFITNNLLAIRTLKNEERKFWARPATSWCFAGITKNRTFNND